jgi:hypothetical protein
MRPPLPNREIASLAKNIAKWTWKKRLCFCHDDKNRGAMGFEPMQWFSNKRDFIEEVRHRQAEGAKYTNELRRTGTEAKIIEVIHQLQDENRKVTKAEVSRRLHMNRSHISLTYDHLFNMDELTVSQ